MRFEKLTQERRMVHLIYIGLLVGSGILPPFIPDHDPQFEDEYEFTYLNEDIRPVTIPVNKEWLVESPFYPFLRIIWEKFKAS